MGFDPIQYKATTRAQWEDAADAWHRWGDLLERWLGEATERMLDAAAVTTGGSVLDVAAGAGGQAITAARRVGSGGRVLATDLSPTILSYAAKAAAEAGVTNVETLEADGESLQGVGTGFDAVISRVGLIYFPDQHQALTGMRDALREGGRVGAIVYAEADRNQFFSVPVAIIRRRAGLPDPLPGQPGPFSLGDANLLEGKLAAAGFQDITVETVSAPLRLPAAADCVRFERDSFGALHQMLTGLDEAERDDVWREIEEALAAFDTPDGFVGPCEVLVAAATK